MMLVDAICPDGDYVDFRGTRQHRRGYLERFLFRPDQMDIPVGKLSGGEQGRLLIARLILRPANVLILDEPTNDLDLPTLGVLEEALVGFDGAVLLVTHDRFFLDLVTTQLLAFHTRPEEAGRTSTFVGVAQWEAWHREQNQRRADVRKPSQPGAPPQPVRKKKLSFNEQRELDTMEARILATEERKATLEAESVHPEVVSNAQRLCDLQMDLATVEQEIQALYARWVELEALKG